MEILGMDHMGPFSKMLRGNHFIVTFTDHFTQWVHAEAIPETSAETIARVYVEAIITKFGALKQVLSDQGQNFIGKVMGKVHKILQVKKLQTTSFHPNTNGLTEWFNKTLLDMLKHQRD